MNARHSRLDRKRQILEIVYREHLKGEWVGITQIAKKLDMAVSTHLRRMVYEMIDTNHLVWSKVEHRPNIDKLIVSVDVFQLMEFQQEDLDNLVAKYGWQMELWVDEQLGI